MRKLIVLSAIAFLAACSGGGDANGPSANEVAFHAEQDLLPGFSFDTGLQPSSGPVQLELVIASSGKLTADAIGVGTNEGGEPALVGKPLSGTLAIDGGFTLAGHLKVDVSGVAKYDGDVPGLTNASITFGGSSTFDPFLMSSTSSVSAPVVGTLPSIPLPGGLPGTLDLTIEPGTTLDFSMKGTCAALDGDQATYHASLARSGTVKITPVVTLKVPIVGDKKFPLPVVTVALPTSPAGVDLGTKTVTFGSDHVEGEHATQTTCAALPPEDAGTGAPDAGPSNDAAAPDADPDADAAVVFSAVDATCSVSPYKGTLTLTPSKDGTTWEKAYLWFQGGSGTHNNATLYASVDVWEGTTLKSSTTTKVLDSTDDYIANDPPRAISSWKPQPRIPGISGTNKITYRYDAKMIFDKSGTSDPSCMTTEIGVTK